MEEICKVKSKHDVLPGNALNININTIDGVDICKTFVCTTIEIH